jgi:hypothetical protein
MELSLDRSSIDTVVGSFDHHLDFVGCFVGRGPFCGVFFRLRQRQSLSTYPKMIAIINSFSLALYIAELSRYGV